MEITIGKRFSVELSNEELGEVMELIDSFDDDITVPKTHPFSQNKGQVFPKIDKENS